MKPPKWTRYDANGNAEPRRSKRLAANGGHGRSNKRARRRYYLRLQLRGRHATKWPAPSDIPHGDVHVYTDGSATTKLGQKKAGCGVWFAEGSPLNISTGMRGRQTSNRAELTAIVLALRRARDWPTLYRRVTVFSDSLLCVNGVNSWMSRWRIDGWTRSGRQLQNADLWMLLSRVLAQYSRQGIDVQLKHVPAHIGILGNERADRLAKAAVRRAHRNANPTPAQQQDIRLNTMADDIVYSILANIR